eukprot:2073117-Amphidinium_carterae.1
MGWKCGCFDGIGLLISQQRALKDGTLGSEPVEVLDAKHPGTGRLATTPIRKQQADAGRSTESRGEGPL